MLDYHTFDNKQGKQNNNEVSLLRFGNRKEERVVCSARPLNATFH